MVMDALSTQTDLLSDQRPNASPLKRWGLLALLLALSGSAGGLVLAMRSLQETPTVIAAAPLQVKTAIASPTSVFGDRTLTGTLESAEDVTLTSRVMGQIQQLFVREGDTVKAGQQIATIDVRDIQAQENQAVAAIPQAQSAVSIGQSASLAAQSQRNQAQASVQEAQGRLAEAQAELADAQLNQKRMATLRTEGAVSQSRLDEAHTRLAMVQARIRQTNAGIAQARTTVNQAEAAMQQAQAQVRQAQAQVLQAQAGVDQTRANLDYGTVVAPFAGVITHKYTEVGAMAGPGQALVKLERSGQLRLSVDVPESLIGQIRRGQTVAIQMDTLQRQVTGRISQIIPSADPTAHTFTVKVALSATQDLLPGMFGRLQLRSHQGGERQGLMIPEAALVKRFGVTGVFKVMDQQAQFQPITTGQVQGSAVEVFSGLEVGDRVIINPKPELKNGTTLQVKGTEPIP
ncbi:MAG: efflux RND transporter periplasmic adaptor subunit [Thermosynechococcaceae cyanobacterium]